MRRLWLLLALAACAKSSSPATQSISDLPHLEAARKGDDAHLATLAKSGDAGAIRALGRIGDDKAIAVLTALPPSPAVAEALWLTGDAKVAPVLAARLKAAGPEEKIAILRGLGGLGTAAELATVASALADPAPAVRATAARALGVMGRHKVKFDDATRAALAPLTADPDPAVRYGVAYAFAGEFEPIGQNNEADIRKLLTDESPDTRALAVRGLGNRTLGVLEALQDDAAVVRIEAVRGFTTPKANAEMRAAAGHWLAEEWLSIGDIQTRLVSDRVQVVFEGLNRMMPFAKEPAVAKAFNELAEFSDVSRSTQLSRYSDIELRAMDTVNCMANAGRVRNGKPLRDLLDCGDKSGRGWETWARAQLAIAAIDEGAGGTPAERAAVLAKLWAAHTDLRVRIGVAATAVGLLPDPAAVTIVDAALAGDPLLRGAVAGGLADHCDLGTPALFDKLRKSDEPGDHDLRQGINDTLTKCKAEPIPGAVPRSPAPPVGADPANVAVHAATLVVATSKGTFHVELRPDLAPWNVATMLSLAEKKFFDGTVWHRVVPGFVAQGGDPTGTGEGGPDYVVPAEPSAERYVRGTVGVADAGKDTGGSQWFVTLAPQPHLEGRYTIIGRVPEADMAVVDRLIVGDTMDKVSVEVH